MPRICRVLLIFLLLPWKAFTAEQIDIQANHVEKTQQRIEAIGNVHATGKEIQLTCSYLLYDTAAGDMWATGDCHLKDKNGEITAETLQYNTKRRDAHIQNGSVLVYAEPVVIHGTSITRYGDDVFTGENITFTPCLGKTPTWSIKSSSLEIPIEGYGEAKHARFQIKDVPVMYVPYILYPVKLKRQSGLLFPSIGGSSDGGTRVGIPVFITLGRSADVTLTPTYLSRRGVLAAAEFNYALDYQHRGQVYAEYLNKDKLAGEHYDGGTLEEIPDSRWYVKANQAGTDLTLDINLVSNPDYFRDIGPLYSKKPEEVWQGPNIESQTEEQISRVQWFKTKGPFSVSVSGQWKQDLRIKPPVQIYGSDGLPGLIYPTENNFNDMTLQELPRVITRLAQRSVPYTPLMYTAELNSVNIYSVKSVRGIKDYGNFELSLPLAWKRYLTVRPFIQEIYRDTRFTKKESSDDPAYQYDNPKRFYFENSLYAEHWESRGVSLTTALYSPRFHGDWYHQLVPGVTWTTKTRYGGNYDDAADPFRDPTNIYTSYPQLLPDDAWVQANDITPSISNYIRDGVGNPVVELTLSRPYSRLIDEWGLYSLTFRMTPNQWVSLEHTNQFGPARYAPANQLDQFGAQIYEHRPFASQQSKTTLYLKDPRGDELAFTQEYIRSFYDQPAGTAGTKYLYGKADINISKDFGIIAETKYNYMQDRFEFIRQGLRYRAQCWGILAYYEVEQGYDTIPVAAGEQIISIPRKTKIGLTINLLGLGDIQTKHSMDNQ